MTIVVSAVAICLSAPTRRSCESSSFERATLSHLYPYLPCIMAASSLSSHPPPSSSLETEDDGSDSELFAELEAELDEEDQLAGFDMGEYRQKRMEEMKKE